ncbi:MAG: helix-turn-helix transcriptional regulator [Deltaproteobacteria bacterium]|nr:helix-turn-helix transcriptional regulator [Deltaproteobacteria bacterium]
MDALRAIRQHKGLSQRQLASLAGLSYKSIQLVESGRHNVEIATLQKIATCLGYPHHILEARVNALFALPPDAIAVVAEWIASEGEDTWQIWVMGFVDAFRQAGDPLPFILDPPRGSARIQALLASTVEALCAERAIASPAWTAAVAPLDRPWFVAGVENLKATAVAESPIYFRRRNIFVLGNFLDRV